MKWRTKGYEVKKQEDLRKNTEKCLKRKKTKRV